MLLQHLWSLGWKWKHWPKHKTQVFKRIICFTGIIISYQDSIFWDTVYVNVKVWKLCRQNIHTSTCCRSRSVNFVFVVAGNILKCLNMRVMNRSFMEEINSFNLRGIRWNINCQLRVMFLKVLVLFPSLTHWHIKVLSAAFIFLQINSPKRYICINAGGKSDLPLAVT